MPMKKIFIAALSVFLLNPAGAQQKPHYTQYILNQYIVNPALTGIENYVDVKLSHRHQWVGLADAPVTTYFTIHGPIGKSDLKTTATSFEIPGENPRGRGYWQEYVASAPHHGWGLQVINDRTGPLNQFSAFGTYAYHVGLTPTMNLSAGIGLGINSISLNTSKLEFNVPVDPAVYGSGEINKLNFDMNAGLYLYSGDYFIGVSAQQIVPSKIVFAENSIKQQDSKKVPHLFLHAGYRFLVGENFNLLPSLMVKYISPLKPQPEANVKLQYQDKFWVGASYRHEEGFAGMAGINIGNTMNIGYAYDYTISDLNTFTKGTHEIMVGFTLGNKYGDTCPRNVW